MTATPEFFLYRDGTNIRIADMSRDQAILALVEMIDDKRLRTMVGTKAPLPLITPDKHMHDVGKPSPETKVASQGAGAV